MADSESASSATPHEPEATVEEVAFALPTDVSVVVALEEAVFESCPAGIGDPLAQGWLFDAVTAPPVPLPVE